MTILLIVATIADLALGVLLVAVSGFVLQGVNNTGPMDGAVWFVLMLVLCVAAPVAAWVVRKRMQPPGVLAIAFSPLIIGALVLLAEPLFV
jgi:hypothetical protein